LIYVDSDVSVCSYGGSYSIAFAHLPFENK
jgi:hypothetical protein